jgi:hypothetical protein
MAAAVVRMEYFIGVLVVVGCFGCPLINYTQFRPWGRSSD